MKYVIIIISLLCCHFLTQAQELGYFIEKALEEHPSLHSWDHLANAKENEMNEVTAWNGPELQIGYGLFPIETRVGPQIFRFGVSQAIKWSGLQDAQHDVKQEELEIIESKRSMSEREIIFRIKNQYLSLYMIDQKRNYLKDFLQLYEELRVDRIHQMESRTGHYSDVLLVERSMKDIERQLQELAYAWDSQMSQFTYWTNTKGNDSIQLQTEFKLVKPQVLGGGLTIDGYPSLISLENEQDRIQSSIELNKWNSYPQLMVGVDYLVNAARQNVDIPDNGKDAIMPRIGIAFPFLYGKYDHAQQKLESESLALEAQFENEYSFIESIIRSATHQQQKAYVNYQMTEELIQKTEEIIDITKAQIGAEHTAFAKFWDYRKEIVRYRLQQLDALETLHREHFIIEKYTEQ